MRPIPFITVFLILLLPGCEDPRPVAFEGELWPGEGRPQFETTGAPLVLRVTPRPSAEVLRRVEIPAGTPVDFDETRYRTLVAGQIAVLRPAILRGRNLGEIRYLSREDYIQGDLPAQEWEAAEGDTIEYLQDRAEGTCFIRFAGVVIDAQPCPAVLADSFRTIREPITEWWIRVSPEDEAPGWVLVEEMALHQVGRAF
jgi:hypothetical protein